MNLIQILMTPNVVINNILICIFGFLEIFLYEKFFTNLLKSDHQRSNLILTF